MNLVETTSETGVEYPAAHAGDDTPQSDAPPNDAPPNDAPPNDAPPNDARRAEPPLTILRPAAGWQLLNFRELWHFRDLLYFLIWRDVKVRYKQTLLGAAWALLQPALMMVVFTLFFS